MQGPHNTLCVLLALFLQTGTIEDALQQQHKHVVFLHKSNKLNIYFK